VQPTDPTSSRDILILYICMVILQAAIFIYIWTEHHIMYLCMLYGDITIDLPSA